MTRWHGRAFREWAFTAVEPGDFTDARVIGTADPETYLITLDPEIDELLPAVLYHRRAGTITPRIPLGSVLKFTLPDLDEFTGSPQESQEIVAEAREGLIG